MPLDLFALSIRFDPSAQGTPGILGTPVSIELCGLRTRSIRASPIGPGVHLTALLTPERALRTFGDPLKLASRRVPIHDVVGAAAVSSLVASLDGIANPAHALVEVDQWLGHMRQAPHELTDSARCVALATTTALDETGGLQYAEALAQTVGISSRQLLRDFMCCLGVTVIDWLRLVRLQRTLGALASGQAMADISAALSFTDQSHMTRVVRRWTRSTPRVLALELSQPDRVRLSTALAGRIVAIDDPVPD